MDEAGCSKGAVACMKVGEIQVGVVWKLGDKARAPRRHVGRGFFAYVLFFHSWEQHTVQAVQSCETFQMGVPFLDEHHSSVHYHCS
eukprot:1158756-Pelagomonas_calceolata.AAC.18